MRLLPQLIVCILASVSSVVIADDAKPIRALLITGGCCHDYDAQINILKNGLGKHLDIQWTVKQYDNQRETRADIYEKPEWANDFDVIVHNECFGGVTDGDFVKSIVAEHVRSGVPAIVIHCSMHSYRNSPMADQWRQLIGVTSRRHERGKRSLEVVAQTPDNPILKSFPSPWKTPNGELYIIERSWPNTKVLATAYSTEEKADQPVVWTNEYKGVRVFGTTLGHHNETMQDDVWLQMTANGIAWATAR
ncbi:MAG: ThuA domain-containing protein [Pirellulaceae bacterium]